MPVLIFLIGALIAFLLQCIFYRRKWDSRLECLLEFQKNDATEGEIAVLTETIINRKWLPLTVLQLKFHLSRHLEFIHSANSSITDNNYRNDIFSIMGYEKIRRELPFRCRRRGYYHILRMDLLSNDIFMTQKFIKHLPVNTSLYVYPAPVDLKKLDIPFQKIMGTFLTRRFPIEDPFEFCGIRQYQLYDTMKDINWKASARTGELKVNVHHHTASQQVTLLLNLESDTAWKYDALFEESIRIAAAYAGLLTAQGVPVRIVSNGVDSMTQQPLVISGGAGETHNLIIKKGLARIDDSHSPLPFVAYIRQELNSNLAASSLYILISRIQNQDLLTAYHTLCLQSPGSQWIAPLHPDMEFLSGSCPGAYTMKWEVPYV